MATETAATTSRRPSGQGPIRLSYVTNRYGHKAFEVTPETIARFWAKVKKTDGCWFWVGSTTRNGYGQFAVAHGFNVTPHRFAWLISEGKLPDPPFGVLHSCDVPNCVRRDHLWAGTQSDNLSDAAKKGRLARRLDACA